MSCPHCTSTATTLQSKQTSLGYQIFHCKNCRRTFNERTGTPYNHLQFPTDIGLLVVLWRLRYSQGSSMRARRDLAEMFLERGFDFIKETLYDQCSARLGSSALRFRSCPVDSRTATFQASGQSLNAKQNQVLVHRRDVHQGFGQMVLLVQSHRPRRQPGRLGLPS